MTKSSAPHSFDRLLPQRRTAVAALDHWRRGQLVAQAATAFGTGDWQEAEKLCRAALEGRSDHVDALSLLGIITLQTERAMEAAALLKRATAAAPGDATTHNLYGTALYARKRYAEAVRSYDRALQLQPRFALAHNNRGVALLELSRPAEALGCFDRAVSCQPDLAEAFNNRGNALREVKRLSEACESFDRAISLRPDYTDAFVNRGITRLLGGDYPAGWTDYEWRWRKDGVTTIHQRRGLGRPLWLGAEALTDKTILLHSEQGLGDTLQFCRYARLVAARGARVILEVPAPLLRLLKCVHGVSQLITPEDPLPPLDCHCPLLSLPLAFRTTLESIPAATRYLESDATAVAKWQARLPTNGKVRVGLVWRGNAHCGRDAQRSIPLWQLLRHLPEGFQYISLQKDLPKDDQSLLRTHPEILGVGAELEDLADTAALCDCLDLVVAADTGVAHLAGSLGRPTWILLPADPDFRWLLDREDSPWYPTAKLYRQARGGDWDQVLRRVAADLQHHMVS